MACLGGMRIGGERTFTFLPRRQIDRPDRDDWIPANDHWVPLPANVPVHCRLKLVSACMPYYSIHTRYAIPASVDHTLEMDGCY